MAIYRFTVYQLVPGTTCHYKKVTVEKTGDSLQQALDRLTETHPGHHIAEHTRGLWEIVDKPE